MALEVPSVDPDHTVILIAVVTVRVLTVPLPSVDDLKSIVQGLRVTVSAFEPTDAVIGKTLEKGLKLENCTPACETFDKGMFEVS